MGDHKHKKNNLGKQINPDEINLPDPLTATVPIGEESFNHQIGQYKTQYVQIPPQDITCANLDKILNARHAEGYHYCGHLASSAFESILIFEKNT